MLRLSNALETVTMLALAGHARLIGALETYLSWRGCKEGIDREKDGSIDTVNRLEVVARSVCHQTVGHHSSADAANKSTTSAVHEKSGAPFPSPVVGW